jgi:hypothetical protein
MKKILLTSMLLLVAGCGEVLFFGAKNVSKQVNRERMQCSLVEGWDLEKVTGKTINCICRGGVLDFDVIKQQFSTMNFAIVSMFFLAPDNVCNSEIPTEAL